MEIKEGIENRRAYRSLDPVVITDELVQDLAKYAGLAPSCFNMQPWRFVFVYDREMLNTLLAVMSKGNKWTQNASLIIAVFSEKELDCIVKEREYFLFDTGMAAGFLILRATELGLVAHPIAGFDEDEAKRILQIPEHMRVITLIICGVKSGVQSPLLNEKKAEAEAKRPSRLKFEEIAFINRYNQR